MKNIMLSGADGTGKSTIALKLQEQYALKDIKLQLVWLRFHHYFAKVINGLGRVINKSYYEKFPWGKIGYHDYKGWIGYLYIISVFFDHIIFRILVKPIILKTKTKNTYLIDRYILDMAADLIVDTQNEKLVFLLFNGFIKEELNNYKAFILECPKELVVKRRPDILDDKKYDEKISAYKLLSQKFNVVSLNTGKFSINEIVEKIINQ